MSEDEHTPTETVPSPPVTLPSAGPPRDRGARARAEAEVPREWQIGDVILDLYEVKDVHRGGGMGLVYRVRHRGWDLELAVKSPRGDYFETDEQQATFVRECETWSELGLHPHTVSCFYVRTLGGIPRVFAEYVEGGSLSDWMRSGRLYEGGAEAALARILDVAIQVAWGLGYAHERGLIHQDVKPANVLLTPEGTAKVTDFGLAKARGAAGAGAAGVPGASVLVSVGGMTPAYCSPEQAARRPLSRRTDIWSWAVSVLEMFVGEVTWLAGQAAPLVLEEYLGDAQAQRAAPTMPATVAELLRHCFEEDPEARPRDFGAVVASLREIYAQQTGQAYARPEPRAAELLADGLNNRAVSLLDLGRQEEAEQVFDRALAADAHHLEATYNRGLLLWRAGRMTDDALVRQLEEVRTTHTGDWRHEYLLGLVHIERGDAESAVTVLEQAAGLAPQEAEIQRAVDVVRNFRGCQHARAYAFEGHKDSVTSVCTSPDGRWALSGSCDGTLRFWELATGRCVRTFQGHVNTVDAVSISPDGRWALSGSQDTTLRLWELATGQCVRTFTNAGWVHSVGMVPGGQWALSASDEPRLRLWNLATGECVRTLDAHINTMSSVSISPDGRSALWGSRTTLQWWDLGTGSCVRTFKGHANPVSSVSVSPDGRWALSGSEDRTLRLWDLATGQCVRTFEGHAGYVTSVCFSPDGRWGLSGSWDNTLRLWDLTTGHCVRTFEGHTYEVNSVAITPDGRWALSGSRDRTVRRWELKSSGPAASLAVAHPRSSAEAMHSQTEIRRALENATRALDRGDASGAAAEVSRVRRIPGYERHEGLLELWQQARLRGRLARFSGGWLRRTVEGHAERVISVCISPDGRWGLSGSADHTLRLWELATGQCVRTFEGHTHYVTSVSISPDGRWGLSGSSDTTLRLWELATGRCVRTLKGHASAVRSVSISPDGRWGLSGSGDYTLRLWELATGQCVRKFEGHTFFVESVSISPDGRWALSGSMDDTLRLWELATGLCVRTLEGHTNAVKRVSFTPDGRWALSGSMDDTVRLWELPTGRCVRVLEGHTGYVECVSTSQDGRWALSGSADKTLRLWELATGQCLRTFEGHTEGVTSVSISPDGRWALSGSDDKTLRLWELDWECEFPPAADWDEGARPYLENFLSLHTPYAASLPRGRGPSEEEVQRALTRRGTPSWAEDDVKDLLHRLSCAGYGWLRPEGVRHELAKTAASWTAPPLLGVPSQSIAAATPPEPSRVAPAVRSARAEPAAKRAAPSDRDAPPTVMQAEATVRSEPAPRPGPLPSPAVTPSPRKDAGGQPGAQQALLLQGILERLQAMRGPGVPERPPTADKGKPASQPRAAPKALPQQKAAARPPQARKTTGAGWRLPDPALIFKLGWVAGWLVLVLDQLAGRYLSSHFVPASEFRTKMDRWWEAGALGVASMLLLMIAPFVIERVAATRRRARKGG